MNAPLKIPVANHRPGYQPLPGVAARHLPQREGAGGRCPRRRGSLRTTRGLQYYWNLHWRDSGVRVAVPDGFKDPLRIRIGYGASVSPWNPTSGLDSNLICAPT